MDVSWEFELRFGFTQLQKLVDDGYLILSAMCCPFSENTNKLLKHAKRGYDNSTNPLRSSVSCLSSLSALPY